MHHNVAIRILADGSELAIGKLIHVATLSICILDSDGKMLKITIH